jgi:excisionase family DNA binding protein
MPRLLTRAQVAERLGLSRYTVRNLALRHRLPVVRLGRRMLFDAEQVEEAIRRATTPAAPPTELVSA